MPLPFQHRAADPQAAAELGRAVGVGPTVGQLLLHRGLVEPEAARAFLSPRLRDLTPPDGMIDRDLAADRLARAVRAGERIAVFGDYDVDGVTSAAILGDVLEALGGDVVTLAGNRFEGGYGFSREALQRCREAGAKVIVTCDCGSSDHERIVEARRDGIDVIVVDHHLVPEEPLPALAFVNPHRPECAHPYKHMASAGLAFSIAAALRQRLHADLDVRPWLDLVAVGTIADMAPLDGDNRRLARAGLERIARGAARPGLLALMRAARLEAGAPVTARDVGWRLGPRLNAPGRLGSAQDALDLLRARDAARAERLAARLEEANRLRRRLGERALREADAMARGRRAAGAAGALVVAGEGWHRGVTGIVAGRLARMHGVVVAVVALDGDFGYGSVRSAGGVDVHGALGRCASLLERWGGHRGAGGFTVRRSRLGDFRAAFEAAAAAEGAEPERLTVDVVLDGQHFPVPGAAELSRLEPFGEGNGEPLFAVREATVERLWRPKDGLHLAMELRVGSQRLRAFGPRLGEMADRFERAEALVGRLQPDTWRGGEHLQLLLEAPGER